MFAGGEGGVSSGGTFGGEVEGDGVRASDCLILLSGSD